MTEHPHATMYRDFMKAMEAGDYQAFADALDEDVEWWEVGASEPIRGKANLTARFQQEMREWEITGNVHDVLDSDDHLVALIEAVGKRGDRTFNYRTAEILHVNEEGKITQRWSFADDTQAVKAFFS